MDKSNANLLLLLLSLCFIGLGAIGCVYQKVIDANAFFTDYPNNDQASSQELVQAYRWNRWGHQNGMEVAEPPTSDLLFRFRTELEAVLSDTLDARLEEWVRTYVWVDPDREGERYAYFIEQLGQRYPFMEFPYLTSEAILDGGLDLTQVDATVYAPLLEYLRLEPAVLEVCEQWAPVLTLLRQEKGCTLPQLCRYDSICQTIQALQPSSSEAPFAALRSCIPSPDEHLTTMRRIYATLQQENDTLPHQTVELVSETIPQTLHLYTETGTPIHQTTLDKRPMPFDVHLSSSAPTQRLLQGQTYRVVTRTPMPEGVLESSATFRYDGRPTVVVELMNSNTHVMVMTYEVKQELRRRSQQRLHNLTQATLSRKRTQRRFD